MEGARCPWGRLKSFLPRLLGGPEARPAAGSAPASTPGGQRRPPARPLRPGLPSARRQVETTKSGCFASEETGRALPKAVQRYVFTSCQNGWEIQLPPFENDLPPPPSLVAAPGVKAGRMIPQTCQIQATAASAAPRRWPTFPPHAGFQPTVNFYGVALKAREQKLGSGRALGEETPSGCPVVFRAGLCGPWGFASRLCVKRSGSGCLKCHRRRSRVPLGLAAP